MAFDDLESLNAWLYLQCDALGSRPHPEQQDQTVDAVFGVIRLLLLTPVAVVLAEPVLPIV